MQPPFIVFISVSVRVCVCVSRSCRHFVCFYWACYREALTSSYFTVRHSPPSPHRQDFWRMRRRGFSFPVNKSQAQSRANVELMLQRCAVYLLPLCHTLPKTSSNTTIFHWKNNKVGYQFLEGAHREGFSLELKAKWKCVDSCASPLLSPFMSLEILHPVYILVHFSLFSPAWALGNSGEETSSPTTLFSCELLLYNLMQIIIINLESLLWFHYHWDVLI